MLSKSRTTSSPNLCLWPHDQLHSLAPGSDNEQVLDSDIVSLKEGEMWGRRIPNVDSLLDGNGSLDVKFIIYYFNLY